ncbi:DNA/RNA polymerase [Wallemia mellicola]|uniref:DNA polymerase kappa n=1 Tax=Wallemia mellicola TaxID=1708541 RepID=A0A4T0MFJ1_9BASI|nr:DNA/RNA polymerase [Wallemia mellicola]
MSIIDILYAYISQKYLVSLLSSEMSVLLKRLHKEIRDLEKEPLVGISLEPKNPDKPYDWDAIIDGPEGSPYEDGRLWSPALSLQKVMLSLSSLLTDCNTDDPLDIQIAKHYKDNKESHDEYALPKKKKIISSKNESSDQKEKETISIDDDDEPEESRQPKKKQKVSHTSHLPSYSMPSSNDDTTLLRRLAGPSAGKAGLNSSNQDKINKVIHDASKGGKFYNNEVKRDHHTTAKIDALKAILKKRLENANHSSIEHTVENILRKIETERDLSQYIMHCDMDMFYAAVEVLDNPSLKGKAFGVGKGILTTASYEARKFGIRSAMPCFIAHKLCDHFIEVPMRMDRYVEKSRQVMEIFSRFDENMAAASLDEAYLNVTSYMNEHGLTPEEVSQQLRKMVECETGLTVSTGIAPNKTLAKICSDKNKPNGEFTMQFYKDTVVSFMKDLPIRKVPGIGRINERLVQSLGIETCGDILNHKVELYLLRKELQSDGLLRANLGIFSNTVAPAKKEDRKSVGIEKTFQPIFDTKVLMEKLKILCKELEGDLKRTQFEGRTVTLKYKKDTFENFTRSTSVDKFLSQSEEIWPVAKGLLERELPLTLRLMGVRLTNLRHIGGTANDITKQTTSTSYDPQDDSDVEIIEKDQPKAHENDKNVLFQQNVDTTKPFFDDIDEDSESVEESDGDIEIILPNSKFKRKETDKDVLDTTSDDTLECPVCLKELKLSNDEFNNHLDDCLTQQEITFIANNPTPPTKSHKKHKSDPSEKHKRTK